MPGQEASLRGLQISEARFIGTPPGGGEDWEIVFVHTDHLGSPRVVTSLSGEVLSQLHYLPFGEEIPALDVAGLPVAFTGHERDGETGLTYMMSRSYHSGLGRFIVNDSGEFGSLADSSSWNKYAYVSNNPLNLVDPDGHLSLGPVSMLWASLGSSTFPMPALAGFVLADPSEGEWPSQPRQGHQRIWFDDGFNPSDDPINKMPPDLREKEIKKLEEQRDDPRTPYGTKQKIIRRLNNVNKRPSKTAHGADKSNKMVAIGVGILIGIGTICIWLLSEGGALSPQPSTRVIPGAPMLPGTGSDPYI